MGHLDGVIESNGTTKPVLGAMAVPSICYLLQFQTFSYSTSQLIVSFGQVLDHSLLDRFVNVHKICN